MHYMTVDGFQLCMVNMVIIFVEKTSLSDGQYKLSYKLYNYTLPGIKLIFQGYLVH